MRGLLIAISICAAGLGALPAMAQSAENPAVALDSGQLRSQVEQLQNEQSDIPGFAIAAIVDGQISMAATGTASPDGEAMTVATPVRIASVTKTFVAAAILRLYEQDMVNLDQAISGLIATEHNDLLQADGYDTDVITVRHLLMHAAGLDDHFGNDNFRDVVLAQPEKIWTGTEQLALMTAASDPVGEPGEQFHYSDTGYLLLGEIIERVTGQSLADAVRDLNRFDELQLDAMRWEGEEPGDAVPARAHQWLGDIDAYFIHGSVDAFGGGGLIANIGDVARYFDALFNGRVFDRAETLELMMAAPMHPENSPYRIGLFTREIAGVTVYSHGGFWGLEVISAPSLNLTIAGVALDQSGLRPLRALIEEVVRAHAAEPEM